MEKISHLGKKVMFFFSVFTVTDAAKNWNDLHRLFKSYEWENWEQNRVFPPSAQHISAQIRITFSSPWPTSAIVISLVIAGM